jgi:hypothetical protein
MLTQFTVTVDGPEDPGTLLACGTAQGLSSSGSQVQGQYSYSAKITPPINYGAIYGAASNNQLAEVYPTGFGVVNVTQPLDLSKLVSWFSTNVSQLDVSNLPGMAGTVTYHTASPTNTSVVASLITGFPSGGQAVAPAAAPTVVNVTVPPSQLPGGANPNAPVLTSILVTPCNRIYSSATGTPPIAEDNYFATGFYSDNSVTDLTNNVTWSVTTASTNGQGTAVFQAPNILQAPQALGNSTLSITATYQGLVGQSQAATAFFVATPPGLTAISPPSGPPGGGNQVKLFGANLGSTSSITVNGVSVPFTVVTSSELLILAMPPSPTGGAATAPIVVTTPGGTATGTYTYNASRLRVRL